MRAGIIALALFAAACGKYGPPVRSASADSAKPPAVSAAPAASDSEECPDPNAPSQGTARQP